MKHSRVIEKKKKKNQETGVKFFVGNLLPPCVPIPCVITFAVARPTGVTSSRKLASSFKQLVAATQRGEPLCIAGEWECSPRLSWTVLRNGRCLVPQEFQLTWQRCDDRSGEGKLFVESRCRAHFRFETLNLLLSFIFHRRIQNCK